MLKVFLKTDKEIEEEENWYRFGAAIAKGIPMKVCPYYLVRKNGEKVNVSDLSEKDIYSFYAQALETAYKDKKNSSKNDALAEAFKLTDALIKTDYSPSYEGLRYAFELMENDDKTISSWSQDLIKPLASNKIDYVNVIATYLQESKGNFEGPTKEQKLQVVNQLEKNAKNKKLAKTKK